jgi:hypothetical protein
VNSSVLVSRLLHRLCVCIVFCFIVSPVEHKAGKESTQKRLVVFACNGKRVVRQWRDKEETDL